MRALGQEEPREIFSFFSNFDPSQASHTEYFAFAGQAGKIHKFHSRTNSIEEIEEMDGVIAGLVDRLDIEELDGSIGVDSRTGDVYFIYETDTPTNEARRVAQLDAWRKKATEVKDAVQATDEVHVVYFRAEGGQSVVDFTHNKKHFVTVLSNRYELFDAMHDFGEFIPREISGHKLRPRLPLSPQIL